MNNTWRGSSEGLKQDFYLHAELWVIQSLGSSQFILISLRFQQKHRNTLNVSFWLVVVTNTHNKSVRSYITILSHLVCDVTASCSFANIRQSFRATLTFFFFLFLSDFENKVETLWLYLHFFFTSKTSDYPCNVSTSFPHDIVFFSKLYVFILKIFRAYSPECTTLYVALILCHLN